MTTTATTTTMGALHIDDRVEDVGMMNTGKSNCSIDCSQKPSSLSSSSTTRTAVGMTEGRGEEGTVNTNNSKLHNNKRRKVVSFRDGDGCATITDVYVIPSIADAYQVECPDIFNMLFYNDHDYARFRCAEQTREDTMIATNIQHLVGEKRKEQIEEAMMNYAKRST